MTTATLSKNNLTAQLQEKGTLLYRGLSQKAKEEFQRTGLLEPQEGALSVGRGVFFTNDLDQAISFCSSGTLLLTTLERLNPEQRVIDTRKQGYDTQAKQRLDVQLGAGNYNGYQLWEEILKEPTITYEGGPKESFIYTHRTPITKEEILGEITIGEMT